MIFAKTFCKPGSYVEVVPIGLQAMLIYNAKGLLSEVKLLEPTEDVGCEFTRSVDNELLRIIYNIVPTRINLKGGTTYVQGTFFVQELPNNSSGNIAFCATDEYIEWMRRGKIFAFYAGNVISLAASFRGALTTRNWLAGNGFHTLPGIVVPVEMKQETLDMLFSSFNSPFDSNFLAGFYVFEGIEECKFVLSNLYYNRVVRFDIGMDSNGFMKGSVELDNGSIKIFNLPDAAYFNCDKAPNVRILYSIDENQVTTLLKGLTTSITNKMTSYTCPVCHKQVALPKHGPCQCSDLHCLSVLYPDAKRLLSKLALPVISYETYRELVDNHDILCLTDLLTLANYKDVKITATIADILSAITPVSVISDEAFFEKFANSCNNSIDSVLYYLKNPNRILTELNISNPLLPKFIEWINDPYNLTSVQTLFAVVNIKEREKKFEGAPIFRNNAFVITGKFKRGNFKEIASILESYEAKVLTDIDIVGSHIVPNAVITGSTNEDISGRVINSAKSHSIPIVTEDDFFATYDIDTDIVANLL